MGDPILALSLQFGARYKKYLKLLVRRMEMSKRKRPLKGPLFLMIIKPAKCAGALKKGLHFRC
jgi:hypothetical protein